MKKNYLILCVALFLCFSGIAQVTNRKANQRPIQKSLIIKKTNHDYREASPIKGHYTVHQNRAMWDVVFNYATGGVQEAGVESDGNFIYTSDWNSNVFYKYSMTGTLLDSFTIASVSNIRDMAFDGTYFYGGANAATIYKMDFTNHTLIGTITCPAGTTVRNISWDPKLGGFWVGGWATDIQCISPAGTVLGTILATNHLLTGMYGSAYDSWSIGGPYLWVLDQGAAGTGAIFNQISLTTFLPTGVTHDCSTDISSTALAGGAFCLHQSNGQVILGGVAQGEKIFAYELVKQAAHCDISPTQLIAPISSDSLTVSDSIRVTVANNDTIPHINIPVSYIIDGGIVYNDTIKDTIHGGSAINFTFQQPYNFSISGHIYNIEIYTAFGCDTVNTNDTLRTTITNNFDASSFSIDMNPIIGHGTVSPMATFKNTGTIKNYFNVTMKIGTYTSTQTISALAPGASQQITFDPWNAVNGNYNIKIYTQLTNDMDHSNDTLTQAITVQNLTKAYCVVAYDPTSALPTGPAFTSLEVPGVITSIANQASDNMIEGGAWGLGNKWYGTVYTDKTLVTIDTTTGTRTVIGNMGVDMNGLTYDNTTNKFFGVSWNGSSSSLYSISPSTGAASLIGNSSTDVLINIACDTLGNLYSLGINNDMLYSVNKSTGLATSIGSIGFDASYAQDMEFDHYTNQCYLAGFNNTTSAGELSLINTVTGAATLVGTFENGSEITGFAIPYNAPVPNKDASVSAYSSPASACGLGNEDITITIDNLGATAITGFSVNYTINGGTPVTETYSGTIAAGASQSYTFTQKANLSTLGTYVIKAYSTLTGDAFKANDTLKFTVNNIATSAVPYSMGFETTEDFSAWKIEDANTDGFTWNIATTGGNNGAYCVKYSYNTDGTTAANDWLITKCIDLDASKSYKVSYYYKVEDGTYPEGLTVNIGTASTSAAQTTSIATNTNLTNTSYILGESVFTVPSTGTYYLGFQCSSAANEYNLYLDDINITDVTGIKESSYSANVNVFPNPTKNILNISSTENISSVKIINVFGQVVYTDNINSNHAVINTSAFAEGIYFIQMQTAKGNVTKNITIQK